MYGTRGLSETENQEESETEKVTDMIHDKMLLLELDMLIADMHTANQDLPIAIFGDEGSGKSTFTANLTVFLDRTFTSETVFKRVAQTVDDFARKAPDTGEFQAIWWDEAHRFSKRGSYDTDVNRVLLEYFQDIRGRKRIYQLDFPELREIDRKVVQRCKLFFETIKKGNEFLVRGWSKKQILATIDCYRLPSAKSKALRWAGLPFHPIRVFKHDYKDFPLDASKCSMRLEPIPSVQELMKAYASLKDGSLRRSDEKLRSYGSRDPIDIANEIMRLSSYTFKSAKDLAYDAVKFALNNNWCENGEIEVINGRYKIKDDVMFNRIIEHCLTGGSRISRKLIPTKNDKVIQLVSNTPMEMPANALKVLA